MRSGRFVAAPYCRAPYFCAALRSVNAHYPRRSDISARRDFFARVRTAQKSMRSFRKTIEY